jgi:cyanophycinase
MTTTLIALGGAVKADTAPWQEFYTRAGGRAGRFVIIPTASALVDTGERYTQALQALGARYQPIVLAIASRADTTTRSFLTALKTATGIFIAGGDQLRLTSIIGGTPIHEALLAAYRNGAIVSGSSAGAACQSGVMIAFGKSGATPRHNLAQLCAGLGFTPRVIFDQHFRQRDRLGRLLYAVALNPGLIGVGVDENTAAILEDDRLLTVCGQNAVTVVDGHDLIASSITTVKGAQPIGLSNARVHVLTHGSTYDLDRRVAQIANSA